MHATPTAKPIIHLGQLRHVAAAYLHFRALGFTRAAIESHLCGLLLLDKELVEEVEAVLTQTATNPVLPVALHRVVGHQEFDKPCVLSIA